MISESVNKVSADMSDSIHESCAYFGVSQSPPGITHGYLGLYALQHRGQESTGIAAADGRI